MIVHFFTYDPDEKFNIPYIKYIKENYDISEHTFLIWGKGNNRICENIYYKNDIRYVDLILLLYKCDKIIFHSLSFPYLTIMFTLLPELLKKTYWVAWGGDLHLKESHARYLKYRVFEIFRIVFFRRLHGICTLVSGDYDLFRKWYKSEAKHFDVVYGVASDSIEYIERLYLENKNSCTKRVLLGNSATESNNHFEIIDKLINIDFDEVICPLSYGNKEYAERVIAYGKEKLGVRFVPLKDYIDFNDYIKMLNTIDVAIFNQNRQQGLGNLYILLLLGKKVYMNPNSEMYDQILNIEDYSVFSTDTINSRDFFTFNQSDIKKNHDKMKYRNSIEYQNILWNAVFEDIC